MIGYRIADAFFIVFHTCLIIFNVFGWSWKRTRTWNLITLLLTGASWGILGIWYGFGYCPFTDWHFDVLRELGKQDLPGSYIQYLLDRLLDVKFQAALVDKVTLIVFLLSLTISVYLNVRDYKAVKR